MYGRPIIRQSGVVPFRVVRGAIDVLLITNRGGGRWLVPKGHVEPGLTPLESARKEAIEEAGVEGVAAAAPLGSYVFTKRGAIRVVELFPLEVRRVRRRWQEQSERLRAWVPLATAALRVTHPGLGSCLLALPRSLQAAAVAA